jgi:S1-C subfamily serine protease
MIAPAGRALLLIAMVLGTGLSVRATVAQERQGIERAYQDLLRSVVRIEARYASIFAPPGAGSGVVISRDGLIATADHVLDGAAEIWVVRPRRRAAARGDH